MATQVTLIILSWSYADHMLISCWSYFKAFSMGTQVTSPGAKAPDKEKVQEILKVRQFWCWAKKEILKVSQFWYWAKKRDLKGEPILVLSQKRDLKGEPILVLSQERDQPSFVFSSFVSSVRSSSGYHGLIEIRSSNPLFQIFQILQILKWKWKWKDPTCVIFLKSMGFKDIEYDIPVYQM